MLVEKLLALLPELKRLRLSSIDAIEADPVLMRVIAEEERLMPHFHLSAQSGDDLILKRMKRRHGRADVVRFCDEVRRLRPEAAFGADLIAGFPTESEAMFESSLSLVDDAGLSRLHVFGFSPRPGTPAARMPQLPGATIKQRATRLRQKGEAALAARLDAMIGTHHTVLMERGGIGRTPCFTPVEIRDVAHGTFCTVHITGRRGERLTGLAA
jgi:threonylcarbamoyladenosine tRNA methylthiotransferase MtaB